MATKPNYYTEIMVELYMRAREGERKGGEEGREKHREKERDTKRESWRDRGNQYLGEADSKF